MTGASSTASVDSNTYATIGGVFETSGHGQGGSKLSVNLRFRRPGSDRTPGNQVGSVLRRDSVQEFASRWKTHLRDIKEKPSGDPETLVYLEAAIELGIVDKAFPAHSGPWLFEVDTHYDVKVVPGNFGVFAQSLSILQSGIDVVDRARPVQT